MSYGYDAANPCQASNACWQIGAQKKEGGGTRPCLRGVFSAQRHIWLGRTSTAFYPVWDGLSMLVRWHRDCYSFL
jgi:hypothetical protein